MAPSGWWQHFSSPLGFPTFVMGSPLQGRRLFVLDRNEGLVSRLGQVLWSVHGWPSRLCLRRLCEPCPSGCVAGWSYCVRELRLYIAPSSVLHCPMLGFSVASTTLAAGLGLAWVPCPTFCRRGFCTSVGGLAGALLPGGPHWSYGSWEVLGSRCCAPLAVGPLPGPPALLCLLSAGCVLGLKPSPSGEASASAWQFSWRPVAAGALAVVLPATASRREFFPLCLVLPLQGSVTFLAFAPQLEALSESLTHSIPRSFLVVA